MSYRWHSYTLRPYGFPAPSGLGKPSICDGTHTTQRTIPSEGRAAANVGVSVPMGGGREYLRCDLEEREAHARDAFEEESCFFKRISDTVRGHHRLLGHRHLRLRLRNLLAVRAMFDEVLQ